MAIPSGTSLEGTCLSDTRICPLALSVHTCPSNIVVNSLKFFLLLYVSLHYSHFDWCVILLICWIKWSVLGSKYICYIIKLLTVLEQRLHIMDLYSLSFLDLFLGFFPPFIVVYITIYLGGQFHIYWNVYYYNTAITKVSIFLYQSLLNLSSIKDSIFIDFYLDLLLSPFVWLLIYLFFLGGGKPGAAQGLFLILCLRLLLAGLAGTFGMH